MTLFEGMENKTYRINAIQTTDHALKHRLISLGITRNCEVLIERFSLNKATLEIQINHSKIALRDTEAQHIIIETL